MGGGLSRFGGSILKIGGRFLISNSRHPRNLRGMNSCFAKLLPAVASAIFTFSFSLQAEVVSATVQTPPPAETGYFKLGTTKNPAGHEIGVNSRSLLFDGQPVFPVMGEFHYSRCPQAEWREELVKMKAGGVDIVATYVFWIHHEEIEGQWNWSGQRDLKKFLQTCNELGLKAVVRCGPWCHGDLRFLDSSRGNRRPMELERSARFEKVFADV